MADNFIQIGLLTFTSHRITILILSMWRKFAIVLVPLALAFTVLLTSILRSAAVKYEFKGETAEADTLTQVLGDKDVEIAYQLPYQGRVLPDSPLWPIKALRDKMWLFLTSNASRKAELKLLFADKRLTSSKILFEKDKPELAYTVLSKAEKYLEEAGAQERINTKKGMDTTEFLERLALASLKHYQEMEEMKAIAPEDAKPKIAETQSYAKNTFESARNALNEKGKTPPENPFGW